MQIAVIWLCHVFIIFWTVSWPIHYMTFTANLYMKYIHVLIVIVATIAPAVVLLVAFMTGGFRNTRFPPVLCVPKNADAGFFSLVLPISVMLPTGASLLLATFLAIRKVMVQWLLTIHNYKTVILLVCSSTQLRMRLSLKLLFSC